MYAWISGIECNSGTGPSISLKAAPIGCTCDSIIPGTTHLPPRSIFRVFGSGGFQDLIVPADRCEPIAANGDCLRGRRPGDTVMT